MLFLDLCPKGPPNAMFTCEASIGVVFGPPRAKTMTIAESGGT